MEIADAYSVMLYNVHISPSSGAGPKTVHPKTHEMIDLGPERVVQDVKFLDDSNVLILVKNKGTSARCTSC